MNISVFWVATPCSPSKVSRRFGVTCRLRACYLLSRWFLVLLTRPWRWRRCIPSKRRLALSGIHGVVYSGAFSKFVAVCRLLSIKWGRYEWMELYGFGGCSAWCKPRISIGGERPLCQVECGGPTYISAQRGADRAVSIAPWQCTRRTGTSSWTKSDTASAGRHDGICHCSVERRRIVVLLRLLIIERAAF